MKSFIAAILLLGGSLLCSGYPYGPSVVLTHNDEHVSNSNVPPSRSFDMEIGSTRGSLHYLNDQPPEGRIIIFLDSVAGVEGKVKNWQFFTMGQCSFCLGIFNRKKTLDGRTYYVEFAGQNCFEVYDNKPMITDYEIPKGYRLVVNANSMVGIIYKDEYSERCIRMESNQQPRMEPGLQLGRIMVLNPSDLPYGTDQQKHFPVPGTIVKEDILKAADGVTEYHATPSIKAAISGPTKLLTLSFGTGPHDGVAMFFKNEVWGTICDLWYHNRGWPQLFCDEKDLPATDYVFYNTRPLPENTPINLMNPHCKESENTTMFQCRSREDQPCGHDSDLYIQCKRGVELRGGGSDPSQGVCYVYESNYWGSVCDMNKLQITGKNHWANVCCREAGYKKAHKLDYASQIIPKDDSISKAPISMYSPTCASDPNEELDSMKSCRDGPVEHRCNHDMDVYIYCM